MESKLNTFVFLHLNNPMVRRALETLRKNTPPNFYVILIDQNKEKNDYGDLVDVHIRTRPLGFGKAANTGIRLADTKYVTVCNDDIEFLHPKWWDSVMNVFERYGEQCLAVNPSSPRNLDGGGIPTDHDDKRFHHKEEWTEAEYDEMVKEVGKGYIIDGICTWATVFDKERLNLVKGTIPDKCWFDELYFSGGEDYDLNRRAYLTKREENGFKGYRMLGDGGSFIWHWWCETKNNLKDTPFAMDGYEVFNKSTKIFKEKWGAEADIWGRDGRTEVPMNIIKQLDEI